MTGIKTGSRTGGGSSDRSDTKGFWPTLRNPMSGPTTGRPGPKALTAEDVPFLLTDGKDWI